MQEHRIAVTRSARYYTLGETHAGTREIWIVCHGYAQLARYFLRSFTPLDDGSRLIAAPEALNRYYFETAPGVHAADARVAATWMTREDREAEIHDYMAYLDVLAAELLRRAEAQGAAPRLVALGFSQGAATVSRWAAHGRTRIDHVVLWGSSLAHELVPGPDLLRGAALTIAIGDADEHARERVPHEDRRLRDAGMEYELLRFAGGHGIEPDALLHIATAVHREARTP